MINQSHSKLIPLTINLGIISVNDQLVNVEIISADN